MPISDSKVLIRSTVANQTLRPLPMHSRQTILRHVLVSLSFVLLYLLLCRPEVILISREGYVAWYPAIGVTIAFLLGISPIYAVLACVAGALAGTLNCNEPAISFSSTIDPVLGSACYAAAAYLLRGPLQIDLGLRHRRDVVRYVLVGGAAAVVATIIGVACLIADHSITWREYKAASVVWFLGDTIGLVGIAPFLLVHVLPRIRAWLSQDPPQADARRDRSTNRNFTVGAVVEVCCQCLTIVAVLLAMFGSRDSRYSYFYLGYIPVIWIAMRQGIRRVVTGLLVLNFGIVVAMHLFPPNQPVFAKIALYMLVQSTVGLIVGSEVSERHRLAIAMKEQAIYLDSLIQNSPLGTVVLDEQGRIKLANSAFEKLFQYKKDEFDSIDITKIGIPDSESTDSEQLIPRVFAGNAVHTKVRQQRRDGQVLDLALYGVPLMLNDEVCGAYLIYQDVSEETKAIEAQMEHAESLDLLVKELQLRTRQMTLLNEMNSFLECSGSVLDACAVVSMSMQRLFPEAHSGSLYLFKASRNVVETAARWGETGVSEEMFLPDSCWSLRRGEPHWTENPGSGITCGHLSANSDTQCLCVPMVAQGNTIGVLHLEIKAITHLYGVSGEEGSFRDGCQRLAISAASQIALSLASLQMREVLRDQSIRDPLTHLFNRRFLEESLERELQLASRKKQALTVLFVDLDYFKKFNDTFGHGAGDMVLQSLADLFRASFRSTDICCRYGGEEFAIVMPEASAQDAAIRANALRNEVKSLRLRYKNQPLGPISLSAGVATFPDHGSTADELLRLADQCLYESKARGRDTVTVASSQHA